MKELSNRFEAPIPRRIVKSIKQSAASVLDDTIAAASGWIDHGGKEETSSSKEGSDNTDETVLCMRYPNHWACRGAATTSHAIAPPSFKVLHLVRDVRGVLLSRLSLEAFCGDQTPLACATPLCNVITQHVLMMNAFLTSFCVCFIICVSKYPCFISRVTLSHFHCLTVNSR